MTKIQTGVVFFFILVTSQFCKKNSSLPNGYYVTMEIDNKKYSFDDSLFGIKQGGQPALEIFALGKTSGQLMLLLSDYNTGMYMDTYDTSVKKFIYQFTINAIVLNNNNSQAILQLLRPGPATSNPISLTITSLTNSYVAGDFSGILINSFGGTSNVTNGHFKVPFK